jgi:hypothetical protein
MNSFADVGTPEQISIYSSDTIDRNSNVVVFNQIPQQCRITGTLKIASEEVIQRADRYIRIETIACGDMKTELRPRIPTGFHIGKLPIEKGTKFAIDRPMVSMNEILAATAEQDAKRAAEAINQCEAMMGKEKCHQFIDSMPKQ